MTVDNKHESANSKLRPYWVPDNMVPEDLPEGLQAVTEAIIGPAYERLVVGAPTALEQLTGMSAVFLSQLEAIDQVELTKELAEIPPDQRGKRIDGHLRLVGAKLRCTTFLEKMGRARERSNENRRRFGPFPVLPPIGEPAFPTEPIEPMNQDTGWPLDANPPQGVD